MEKHAIHARILLVVAALLLIVAAFACSAERRSAKVKLDFEWHNLDGYEYDTETDREYLIFRRIEPENPETHVSDWTYIRVDAANYHIQEKKNAPRPQTDRRSTIDTSRFPFWKDGMFLENVKESPDGSKAVITVFSPRDDGYSGNIKIYFLRVGNQYEPIENIPFLFGVVWANDAFLYSFVNPLDLYDTNAKQWLRALPESENLRVPFHIKPKWINEYEFLTVLAFQRNSFAARVDCLKRSVVTLLPLEGEVVAAEWSDKDIGVLWYQSHQTIGPGTSLYRFDMGLAEE